MSYHIVNIYYEFNHYILNPITNTNQSNFNGMIYLPLNYQQLNKLSNLITNNNIGNFSKLFIVNVQNVFKNDFDTFIQFINKDNFVFNNEILPMYYIIQSFEMIIL
jgi:hypothetical protein